MEGSDDVHVHKFTISLGGKTLFHDAKLSLAYGRRYGLIGPNGCGKSTLMTAIGRGGVEEIQKGIPPNMDILLVEQEVDASDEITALQMVVQADERRTKLLEQQAKLEAIFEKGGDKYWSKPEGIMKVGEPGKATDLSIGAKVRFKGRKLGIYIAEGGDAGVVKALKEATESAGGMVEIVAPHVAGAKLSDGNMMEADEKIDGGPSVAYDAVAVVMSEASAKRYNTDKPSIDFVNDAFAHAKFVAYVPEVKPLFETAGVWNWMDDGFVDVSSGKDAASDFIEKCGKLRFWDRESVKQD